MKLTSTILRTGLAVTTLGMLLTSCTGYDMTGQKGQLGALGGAAGGALLGQAIGHNTESTLIGAAVGTMAGYIIGNEMDKFDQQQMTNAFETGRSNQPVSWQNPDTRAQYTMVPEPVFQAPNGTYCRNAQITAVIDGRQEVINSQACRDSYGNWSLQDSSSRVSQTPQPKYQPSAPVVANNHRSGRVVEPSALPAVKTPANPYLAPVALTTAQRPSAPVAQSTIQPTKADTQLQDLL